MIFLEMTLLVIKHIFYYYLDDDVLAFVLRSHGDTATAQNEELFTMPIKIIFWKLFLIKQIGFKFTTSSRGGLGHEKLMVELYIH